MNRRTFLLGTPLALAAVVGCAREEPKPPAPPILCDPDETDTECAGRLAEELTGMPVYVREWMPPGELWLVPRGYFVRDAHMLRDATLRCRVVDMGLG